MIKKVGITGAGGLIGVDLSQGLSEKYELTLFYRKTKPDISLKLKTIQADLSDEKQIKGILVTRTADTGYVKLSGVKGNKDLVNYHLELDELYSKLEEGTDIWAIHQGYISITPLRFEITHHEMITAITGNVEALENELFNDLLD